MRDICKEKNRRVINLGIVAGVFVTLVLLVCNLDVYSKYENQNHVGATDCYVEATLYDKSDHSDAGVSLTADGGIVTGWSSSKSKFLKISVHTKAESTNAHIVDVELPKELYFANTDMDFGNVEDRDDMENISKVTYTKNSDISNINGYSSNIMYLNSNSGKLSFQLSANVESATIELEVRYDDRFWDKQDGSALTKDSVKPINITMYHKTSSNLTQLNSVCLKKATAVIDNFVFGEYFVWHSENYSSNLSQTYQFQLQEDVQGYKKGTYYEKAVITYNIPYWTDSSGKKVYLKYVKDSFRVEQKDYSKYNCTIDDSQEGKVIITVDNFYYSISDDNYFIDFKLPDNLSDEAKSYDSLTFDNGEIVFTCDSVNGTKNINVYTHYIYRVSYMTNLVEVVGPYGLINLHSYKDVTKSSIVLLGGSGLVNAGNLDASPTIYSNDYPKEILVTTINIVCDTITEYMDINYSLCNGNGELVYFDSAGNEVSSDTPGALSTFVYTLKNDMYGSTQKQNLFTRLTRSQLTIQNHRNYYFKRVEYTVQTVKAGAKLYKEGYLDAYDSAGNFFGYINPSATVGAQVYTFCKAKKPGAWSYRYRNSYVTIRDKKVASGMLALTNKTANTNRVISAGEELSVVGMLQIADSQYGTYNKLRDIRMGLVLPEGVSIDKDRVKFGTAIGDYIDGLVKDVYIKDTREGYNCWVVEIDPDYILGYGDENLNTFENGNQLYFTFTMSTDINMRAVNIYTDDMIFFAGKDYNNEVSGSYYKTTSDPWDLNDNGEVDDVIIKSSQNKRGTISITANTVQVEVNDSITVGGTSTVDGQKATLNSVDDEVTYTVNVKRKLDGTLQKYDHYITIPKKNSIQDVFQVQNSEDERFDFVLTDKVTTEGSDIFDVLYAINKSKSYYGLVNDTDVTWYTIDELLKTNSLSDVTAVKIKLKGDKQVTTSFDSKIHIKMKCSNKINDIVTGNKNIWKSRAYYKFSYNSGSIATYSLTKGCEAEVAFETVNVDDKDADDEEVEDSPIVDADDVSIYDDTPDTSDSMDYGKWIAYMLISAGAFAICQMKFVRRYFIPYEK